MIVKFIEVTEQRYDEMLGVVPPAAWESWRFLVGEPVSDRVCSVTKVLRQTWDGYWYVDRSYYAADKSLTVPEFRHIEPNNVRKGEKVFDNEQSD